VRRQRIAAAAFVAATATVAMANAISAHVAEAARPRWDTRVLATVPSPGYPAFAYVTPGGTIDVGTYDDPRGDSLPSRVFEYDSGGRMLRSWMVPGQTLSGPHGVQVATSDARGRLVLLDLSPPRALLLDRATGTFTPYATFADLPVCASGTTAPRCSPSLRDEPPEPDYAVWQEDGSLLVSDYQQAVIWRVPPGGGAARVWLADPRVDGDMFGTAGLAWTADRRHLLVTQGSSAGGNGGNPTTGKLYAVTVNADGSAGALAQMWESRAGDLPDGLAVGQSQHIYIALVGLPQQLVELGPDGTELTRFPSTPFTGDNGSPEPFDNPSSVRFIGTRLIVPNQSYVAGNPQHWTLLDVETGESGLAEFIPATAGVSGAAAAGTSTSTGTSTPSASAQVGGLPDTSGHGVTGGVAAGTSAVAVLLARRRRRTREWTAPNVISPRR
jgi:hypothetical protein